MILPARRKHRTVTLAIALYASVLFHLELKPYAAAELLPDLVPIESLEDNYMHNGEFDLTSEPGRVLYRFDAVLANLGEGPFQVFETTDFDQMTQDIYQDVFETDGSFTREFMATFDYEEPLFGHLSFNALARYNLLEVTSGNGVGEVVATADKTSHAVVDSVEIDNSLPGAPTSREYTSANDNPLGISVGYADLYGRNIPTQRIDLTGVPSGQYWLEVFIDPNGVVRESDTTNNKTRILVDLEIPTTGDYDQDGDVDGDDFLLWQAGSSPNPGASEDFASWQDNYGTTYPDAIGASIHAVPEPRTLLMLSIAVILMLGDCKAWRAR